MRVLFFIFFVATLCFSQYARASDRVMLAALGDDEMADLLSILKEETEIATKTKMNADYVPGIVTVLHGEDMEALGLRTVHEALGMVPSIDSTINNEGGKLAIVRGIGSGLHIGQLKVLINGAPANLSTQAGNQTLMLLPVEQVERIEIIRGPGAAVYGEYAYMGVINIITRKEGNRIYGFGGSFSTMGGGVHISHYDPKRDMSFSLSVSGWQTDGADVDSGLDGLIYSNNPTNRATTLSPGKTNEDEKLRSVTLSLNYKKTNLNLFMAKRDNGAYFGVNTLHPDKDGTLAHTEYWSMEASQGVTISPTLDATARVQVSENDNEVDYHMVHPPGFTLPPPLDIFLPDGLLVAPHITERRIEAGVDLKWTGWERHLWTLGLTKTKVEITEAYELTNFIDPVVYPTLVRPPDANSTIMPKGVKRYITSVVLQDQFQFTENITITGGLRYDDYDDVGGAVAPRLAAVWRVTEPHIVKVQYARAFMPPSLAELHYPEQSQARVGNPNLKPQWIDTYEVGYIFHKAGTVARATAYYSSLRDMIGGGGTNEADRQPHNSEEKRLRGVELELERQLNPDWKVLSNISFMKTEDMGSHHEEAASTNLLANLVVMGRLSKDLLVTARYHYVGERYRGSIDSRPKVESYNTVDLTANYFNAFVKGLTVRAGVKNLFNEDVRAYAQPRSYENDLPRPGTTWWAQLSKSF